MSDVMSDENEDKFFILSLKWTDGSDPSITWWGKNNCGYTNALSEAGRYTANQVRKDQSYYDNRKDTLAVPCVLAEKWSEPTIPAQYVRGVPTQYVKNFKEAAEAQSAGVS